MATNVDGSGAGRSPVRCLFRRISGKSWSLNEPLWNVPERKDWMGAVSIRRVSPRSASIRAIPATSRLAYRLAASG